METVIEVVALIALVAVVRAAARRARLPDPILLLLVGVGLAFVPGVPPYRLDPELVLVAVLPLLLYGTAFNTSLPTFRANARSIVLLSVGLTLFTTIVVGYTAHAVIPGLSLAAGMVLGAIVAPPDAVAASAVSRHVGMPRRALALLEGESLFNDAAALTALGVAVAAVVDGSFSLLGATGDFAVSSLGGLVIGVVVAWPVARLRNRVNSPLSDVSLSLVSPFVAYFPAEALGASGLVAVVVVGLHLGHRSPILMDPLSRVLSGSVWRVIQYLLEGALFVLIGLQLPDVVAGLENYSPALLVGVSAAVVGAVVLSRLVWTVPGAYLPPLLIRRIRERETTPPWQEVMLVSWVGMRGVISLAAALALPLTVRGGAAFPHRNLLLFLTFVVIGATLVGQGFTLPTVVRRLRVPTVNGEDERRREAEARYAAATAALRRLDALLAVEPARSEVTEQLRRRAENRQLAAQEELDADDVPDDRDAESHSDTYRRIAREMMAAEREQLVRLRNDGRLDDEAFRRVQRELDLEEAPLLPDR